MDTILLRRLSGRGIYLEVRCAARIDKFTPEMLHQIEQAGGIAQGDRTCIISNREIARQRWPGPPRRGDMVIILGANGNDETTSVTGCDTSAYQGQIIRHDLTLRGN